jgi:hypothetical protein
MYLLTYTDHRIGATRHIPIPKRDLASFAAQEIINLGHTLVAVQHARAVESLSVDQVKQTREAKAAWRQAYGRDIYSAEEAYYRRELAWGSDGP